MKGSRILACQLDCGDMRAGISPGGSRSPAGEDASSLAAPWRPLAGGSERTWVRGEARRFLPDRLSGLGGRLRGHPVWLGRLFPHDSSRWNQEAPTLRLPLLLTRNATSALWDVAWARYEG